jgi:hypothetical protein
MATLTAGMLVSAAVAIAVFAAAVILFIRYAEMRNATGFPVPVSLLLAALAAGIARVMIGRFLHRHT